MGDRTALLRREAEEYRQRAIRATGAYRADLLRKAERRDQEADERESDARGRTHRTDQPA